MKGIVISDGSRPWREEQRRLWTGCGSLEWQPWRNRERDLGDERGTAKGLGMREKGGKGKEDSNV